MTRTRTGRRNGFMLVELVFVLGMIAVAALISTQLYVDMTRAHGRMLLQQEAQQRFDLALRPLRSDVWNATTASVDKGGTLYLTRPDGKGVQWQAGDRLSRTIESQPPREWNQLGANLSFVIRDGAVVLREEPSQSDTNGGEIVLPLVAGGLKGQTP